MKWPLFAFYCAQLCAATAQTYQQQAVAAVLMGEARSEGAQGMTAVAEVIHQRSVEKNLSPLQVVRARRGRIHAFSSLNGTTIDRLIRTFRDAPDYPQALEIARIAIQSPEQLPGLTKMANHYTRISEHPYWARGQRPVAIVGHHAFYRLAQY